MTDTPKIWTAADVMQTAVHTVPSSLPLAAFEEQLIAHRVSGFPVVDHGRLVGVISRTDVIRQICEEREVAEKTSDFYFDETGFHEDPMDEPGEIAERIGERMESLTVGDVMARLPATIPLDLPLVDVAHKFIALRVHRLPVTDNGVLVGIVTTTDLVRLIADGKLIPRR